jgi:hypothetical protein
MLSTFISKLKSKFTSRLKSKFIVKKNSKREFNDIETILLDGGNLSVIMEADELDEMGVDWDVDGFGTLFWETSEGEWVEGFFDREYGFTAM